LISKKSTSSWGGRRKLPNAFTEQGIYMLMTVLRGELAVKQSKALIRMFKQMKDFIIENQDFIGSKELVQIAIQTKIGYGTENEAFYLCGVSSKDAGNKVSSVTKIEESSKDMYHDMFSKMLSNKELKI